MPGLPTDCPERAALDAGLIAAHRARDWSTAAALHRRAAEGAALAERRFHLTHAWVFALEAGEEETSRTLERELQGLGGL